MSHKTSSANKRCITGREPEAGRDQEARQFEEWLTERGLAASTISNYLQGLAHFQKWFEESNGEEFTPAAVTHIDLFEYRQYMIVSEYEPSSANGRLTAVKKYLTCAQERGLIETVPRLPRQFRVVKVSPRALERKEQLALLRTVEKGGDLRDKAIIVTLLETGLRVSELVGLRGKDLEIGERSGKVRVLGKGAKSRQVPLSAEARKALRDYLDSFPVNENDRVFRGQRGPLTRRAVEYIIDKYAYQSQLQEVSPHTLRHTFAVNMVSRGVELRLVATLMGHDRLDTTLIYTRPSYHDLEMAIED